MTAPAPGTKEIEEVQPNRDLLFYFMSTKHYSRWCANGGNVRRCLHGCYVRRRALGGVPTVVMCGAVSSASIPGCHPRWCIFGRVISAAIHDGAGPAQR